MSNAKILIRNIYFYLAVFVGLIMIIIPTIDLIKIGLETWFFPLATENQSYEKYPPTPNGLDIYNPEVLINKKGEKLTIQERNVFTSWQKDYKNWQKKQNNIDQKVVIKQISMIRDISTLIGGLFIFLTHGYILRKDKKKEKNQ